MIKFKETTELLAESAFFYTIAIGMDSRYIYVSKNYDDSFDVDNNSLMGKHFSITLHPEDVKLCEQVSVECFKFPGSLFPLTLRKRDGKGGFVFTQWEMQAILDDDDKPKGIFCVGYNITEHMDTQAKLRNANTEIASKESQLNEIGVLQSHGVRRPLANIIGLAGILKTMTLDANLANIRDMIVESAEQLDLVIKETVELTSANNNPNL